MPARGQSLGNKMTLQLTAADDVVGMLIDDCDPHGPASRSIRPRGASPRSVESPLLAFRSLEQQRSVLRILFPTRAPFPGPRASVVQVANMAQAFAELGHDVRLVAPAPGPGSSDGTSGHAGNHFGFHPKFDVATLSRRIHRGQSYLHAVRIARMTSAFRADLVFSRNLRACLLPARRGVPTVLEAHTLGSLSGPQERWVLRHLEDTPGYRGIVAISQALADDLTSELSIDPARILVAHDAVRIAPANLPEPAASPLASKAHISVGYTGSMFPGRGVELLIELVARDPRVQLHLVGGPVGQANAWADQLTAPEEQERIIVHGPVSPARTRELQRGFDVLVAPFARRVSTDSGVDSSRWMSPMKVFEYMASGRPIVISDLPVLREVLRPNIDALMVPPEDLDALATAIGRLADDPTLAARLASSALSRVHDEFTWDLRARRILTRFIPEYPSAPVGAH